ncbi:MAG: chemotaxis protein CheW [Spirochaetales bacterium]
MSNYDNETEAGERFGQYVTFLLDSELYAVDVRNARTVIHEAKVTRIPHMESFVAGLIDFRGHGIPLIDLKTKLGVEGSSPAGASGGMGTAEVPPGSAVLILELPQGDNHITVGVIVDEVHEVIALDEATIEPAPAVGSACNLEYLRGIARNEETFILVLNAERILESGEVAAISV